MITLGKALIAACVPVILSLFTATAGAEQLLPPADLEVLPGGTVTEVVDGDTVFLSNGDEVRMVGIQAPKLPLGRAGFRTWPLADEAKTTLESLVRGRHFDTYFGGRRMDRHGRVLAHLVSPDGIWLQGEMLRLGLARVYSFPDNTALVPEMLALEREARLSRFGIWSHPFYDLRSPTSLENDVGSFQIVEGTVREAAEVRGTVYLNFGANWRSDFTVSIRRKHRTRFTRSDPADWTGRRIRVRGWLREQNGPMIEATHPEQIELRSDEQ